MIIYSAQKSDFIADIDSIPHKLQETILSKLGEESSQGEILSWQNSLRYMASVLKSPNIPDDAGIALEYNIPITNNRIDFIITGFDDSNKAQAILIELDDS